MTSASTQGTPPWLLRLEQAQEQLKTENYITWLLTKATEWDIPEDVIKAQLHRSGYVAPEVVAEPKPEPKPERTSYKAKPGRPAGKRSI